MNQELVRCCVSAHRHSLVCSCLANHRKTKVIRDGRNRVSRDCISKIIYKVNVDEAQFISRQVQAHAPVHHLTMSLTASIPRFLLPQKGSIWRTRLPVASLSSLTIRHASNKKGGSQSSKPIVLEQPSKFNPPSHGSKLRKPGPRYPGPRLTQEDEERMKYKQYPNMMPGEGTFMHWFLTNRSIHLWICLVNHKLSSD